MHCDDLSQTDPIFLGDDKTTGYMYIAPRRHVVSRNMLSSAIIVEQPRAAFVKHDHLSAWRDCRHGTGSGGRTHSLNVSQGAGATAFSQAILLGKFGRIAGRLFVAEQGVY